MDLFDLYNYFMKFRAQYKAGPMPRVDQGPDCGADGRPGREDYSDENINSQDDNPTQASQEIAAGNSALASFNAANGGILNGTIQPL
jgi:hypothetical protein